MPGLLERVTDRVRPEDVGGLRRLKEWALRRRVLWGPGAPGLPRPRGVLLVGIPGCGKSMSCKLLATLWDLPLLRLDPAIVCSGVHGPPEAAFRDALAEAEAAAPCVLWVDEIESAVSRSAAGDAVKDKLLGFFLLWLQERTGDVFVAATANRIDAIPPELTRRGRFDQVFFVDTPDGDARRSIWRIYLERYCPGVEGPPALEAELAEASAGWTPAEIAAAVLEAAVTAVSEGRPVRADDLRRQVELTRPIARVYDAEICRIRAWAFDRALPAD